MTVRCLSLSSKFAIAHEYETHQFNKSQLAKRWLVSARTIGRVLAEMGSVDSREHEEKRMLALLRAHNIDLNKLASMILITQGKPEKKTWFQRIFH